MKIIEYNHNYAKLVADMWNLSNSSWGNDNDMQTEQDVITSESNSGNLKLYLAIDNEEVVGYCSFSEYKQDEGASYLPLLNVRPDYHGKKVGKALILKVLEDAIASKWPRFDLYTWSGNIKAMPLYKKCGFFWERNNNTVHLMNFIPYVYQTEALKPYIEQLDWYQDSKRHIDMQQDGREENDFDFYRYDFKNDKTELSLEFERYGRGLTYISNNDYEIRMSVLNHKLVYDQEYKVAYTVVNKTDKPLEIRFQGNNNKNITSDYDEVVTIDDSKTIELPFFIKQTDKVQNRGKTHPCVEADVYINGLKANFRMGILPKRPLEVDLVITDFIHRLGHTYDGFLNVENNLQSKQTFKIKLPNSIVTFKEEIEITLDKSEKQSIKVPYTVNSYGFYNEKAVITVDKKSHTKDIKIPVSGEKESFICDFDNDTFIVSGNYTAMFHKQSKNISIINKFHGDAYTAFMAPKLGKPYSLEFSNIMPEINEISNNEIKIVYQSKAFNGMFLNIYVKNTYGVLEVAYELENKADEQTISLSIPVWKPLSDSYVPYNKDILKIYKEGNNVSNLDGSLIDENWMYNYKQKQGFTWHTSMEMKVTGWHMSFDIEDIKLKKNDTYKTEPFIVSFVHPDLKSFRRFAHSKGEKQNIEYYDVAINNQNPFIQEGAKAEFVCRIKTLIKGTFETEDQKVDLKETVTVQPGLNKFKIKLEDRTIKEKRLLFQPVGTVTQTEENGSLVVHNGLVTFKADMNFADSIYSLQFDGYEWLDSNYPTPKERAWWGDFVGGITQRMNGLQDIAAIKEKRSAEFVTIKDNHGNEWSGIKIITNIEKDPDLKGITLEQYTLTLPGVPLIHTFTNVINKSGKLLLDKFLERFNTLRPADQREDIKIKVKNTTYKALDTAVDLLMDKVLQIQSKRSHDLVFYTRKNDLIYSSEKRYIIVFTEGKHTVEHNQSKIFDGDFIFFTKEDIKKEHVVLFDSIKFEV